MSAEELVQWIHLNRPQVTPSISELPDSWEWGEITTTKHTLTAIIVDTQFSHPDVTYTLRLH